MSVKFIDTNVIVFAFDSSFPKKQAIAKTFLTNAIAQGDAVISYLALYDSLIIAAAVTANCTQLLTEDMQHGQEIEGLMIWNPFITR